MTLTYAAAITKPLWAMDITPVIRPLRMGQSIELMREWNNRFDPNAVGVWLASPSGHQLIGYLEKTVAAVVAAHLEHGHRALSEFMGDADSQDTRCPTLKIQVEPRPSTRQTP